MLCWHPPVQRPPSTRHCPYVSKVLQELVFTAQAAWQEAHSRLCAVLKASQLVELVAGEEQSSTNCWGRERYHRRKWQWMLLQWQGCGTFVVEPSYDKTLSAPRCPGKAQKSHFSPAARLICSVAAELVGCHSCMWGLDFQIPNPMPEAYSVPFKTRGQWTRWQLNKENVQQQHEL